MWSYPLDMGTLAAHVDLTKQDCPVDRGWAGWAYSEYEDTFFKGHPTNRNWTSFQFGNKLDAINADGVSHMTGISPSSTMAITDGK